MVRCTLNPDRCFISLAAPGETAVKVGESFGVGQFGKRPSQASTAPDPGKEPVREGHLPPGRRRRPSATACDSLPHPRDLTYL
jgi:hypothetical protein